MTNQILSLQTYYYNFGTFNIMLLKSPKEHFVNFSFTIMPITLLSDNDLTINE